jgi:hypothetical protein
MSDKAGTMPFRGSFDFRRGDLADPLRQAAVLANIGIGHQRAVRHAA